jgi:hypothetical protein|tara:strand:- start:98 stop:379 length:282 start_codon:yes stop_codon:yes gene_type:complete
LDDAALDELESLFLLALSDLLEELSEELFGGLSEAPGAPMIFFFLPVLKSVSYQPSPFSRNAAAETSLLSFGSLQAGQSRSGSSLIFRSFSNL